jgi:hypothetical protein
MKRFYVRAAVLIWSLATLTLCGGCSGNATGPSNTSLAGTWSRTVTPQTLTGGDCYAAQLREHIHFPAQTAPFAISQSGGSVTTTLTAQVFGQQCQFVGQINDRSFTTLAQSCQGFTLACPEGPGIRDFRFVTAALSGTVDGNTARATLMETWRLFQSGTNDVVGDVVYVSDMNMTRQ